jgi:uncharacterized protein YkwD
MGKEPYYATTPLINAALAHAQDMSAQNYFSHTSLDGMHATQYIYKRECIVFIAC